MNDELFEIAISGEILDGENPEDVKARIGKMFNADEAKIAQLFSGNRVVIKKNVDQQTAEKYKKALNKAGAVCEIKSLSPVVETPAVETPVAEPAPTPPPAPPVHAAPPEPREPIDYGDIAPPPQVDPLGITGDQIEDLAASIAPVGSAMQDNIEEVDEPQFDFSGFDVAPVGSVIGSEKKEPDPPPPDTSGLSMAD